MIRIEQRPPSPDEYRTLRSAVGWQVPDVAESERALAGSAAAVCGFVDEDLAGMARVVGDGTFYSFLVDVVVAPGHQRCGVGSAMVASLERLVAEANIVPVMSLVAASDVVPYWRRLGFEPTGSTFMSKPWR